MIQTILQKCGVALVIGIVLTLGLISFGFILRLIVEPILIGWRII